MATTLTLYKNVELNNKYQDVFRSQALLESYLSTRVSATITGDWYFKISGEFNLPVSKYDDIPNYMKAVDTISGNTTYYFINNYEVYNAVYKISYLIDVWHTYIDIMYTENGRRNLSSYPIGGIGKINTNPVYSGYPQLVTSMFNPATEGYSVLALGYLYDGVSELSSVPSQARPIYLYPLKRTLSYNHLNSYTEAQTEASTLMNKFINTKTLDYYGNITNEWIVPTAFLSQTNSSSDPGSGTSGSTTPFYGHWGWESGTTFYHYGPVCPEMLIGVSNGSTNYTQITYDAIVESSNDDMMSQYSFVDSFHTLDSNVTNYHGIYDGRKSPFLSYTSTGYWAIVSYGYGTSSLPREWCIYSDDVDTNVYLDPFITPSSTSLLLSYGGQSVDIAPSLAVTLNYSPESQQAADQRRSNAIETTVNTAGSVAGGIMGGIGSLLTGNIGGAISSFINAGTTIASTAYELSQTNQSTTSAKQGYMEGLPIYAGGAPVRMKLSNYDAIRCNYYRYGLLVDAYETITDKDERWYDNSDTGDYRVIGYSEVKVCGAIPEQYKAVIETILTNGVRIWNKNDDTLNADPNNSDITLPNAVRIGY